MSVRVFRVCASSAAPATWTSTARSRSTQLARGARAPLGSPRLRAPTPRSLSTQTRTQVSLSRWELPFPVTEYNDHLNIFYLISTNEWHFSSNLFKKIAFESANLECNKIDVRKLNRKNARFNPNCTLPPGQVTSTKIKI